MVELSAEEKKQAKEWREKNRKENPDSPFTKIESEKHPEEVWGVDKETYDLLDIAELNAQYLDLGYHENYWYYGFSLDGKDAIITSDRKILRNLQKISDGKNIGENQIKKEFNYEGYIGDIAPCIPKKFIKKFIKNELEQDARLTINDCFNKVKNKILYYMDFGEQEVIADIQACWVIATYCYPLFYWFPHLLFNCPSESGKSKNAYILMLLSFRGFDLGASAGVTPAQIFRTLEGNRGTIVIDEFERQDKSESYKLVTQILNASATKDAYVIRTEQVDRKWKAWKFPIFCPKIVCNITGINSTSLSRFIVFRFLKSKSEKAKRKPYREGDKISFEPLREDLYLLIFDHWKTIKDTFDTLKIDLGGRDEDNWLPILTIAKLCGNDIFEKILEYIKIYQEIKVESNDLKATLFYTMLDKLTDEDKFYPVKELAGWMSDVLTLYKSPESWIGRTLTEFNFNSVRRGTGKVYPLSKSKVKNIIDRYFPLKDTQPTSTTQVTEDSLDTLSNVANVSNDVSQELERIKESLDVKR